MTNKIIKEDVETISKGISSVADKLSGKTVVITGGAGFLGNYFNLTFDFLNKNVLKEPCKVISVDNFITGLKYQLEESPTFKTIEHDIKIPLKIDGNVDYVIHAAGIGSPEYYRKFKIETIDAGVLGTKNMLELSKEKNAKSFVFFSSSEVYGDPDPNFVPTPETYYGNVSCTGPRSNYDESKRLGETLCVAYYETHNIPVKMIRPFNVYGPGMRIDDYRVIPNFTSSALKGKPLPVYGDGKHTRTFCYVTDGMIGFLKVFLSDLNNESFNVGNEKGEISMEGLAKTFAEIFDNQIGIEKKEGSVDAYKSADPKRRAPDLTKIRMKLGYEPKVDLKTGLKRYIQWAIEEYKINPPLMPVL